MVEKFGLTNAKKVSTPMEMNAQFLMQQCPSTPNQVACMNGIPYSEAIGLVLWPMVVSWLDTAYAVGILLQFMQNLKIAHWEGVKHVISYLESTKDFWLTFGGSKRNIAEGFCDANWASQKDQHSISGFCFQYGNSAISWSSKKKSIIALSSTEAEYVAEINMAKEALWLQSFINEVTGLDYWPLMIRCDNQGAMALAKDNKFHLRTKHIDLRYHFIREAVEDSKIKLSYIPTAKNVADIFMKMMAKLKFSEFVTKLGLGEKTEWRSEDGCLIDTRTTKDYLGKSCDEHKCVLTDKYEFPLEGECWIFILAYLVCPSLPIF